MRLEGAAAFVAGICLYGGLGGPWLGLIPLLLVPDVSMVGYLRGPRVGALVYNLGHTYVVALGTLGLGLASNVTAMALAGAVLLAHAGADRALGFGLKLPTGFQDTHLGRIGRAAAR